MQGDTHDPSSKIIRVRHKVKGLGVRDGGGITSSGTDAKFKDGSGDHYLDRRLQFG